MLRPITPVKSAAVACAVTSARVALPDANTIVIKNTSAIRVAVAFGDSTVTAALPTTSFAAGCHLIAPGEVAAFTVPYQTTGSTYLAYISASGTPTLDLTVGEGQ